MYKGRKNRELANEDRRHALLQAVVTCAVKRGIDGTTTEAIAEAAKMSKGLIHYYFGSKASLIEAALDSFGEYPPKDLPQGISPQQRLRQVIGTPFPLKGASRRRVKFWYQFWGAALTRSSLMRVQQKYIAMWRRFVKKQIEHLQGAGEFPTEADADLAALAIMCFRRGLELEILSSKELDVPRLQAGVDYFLDRLLEYRCLSAPLQTRPKKTS